MTEAIDRRIKRILQKGNIDRVQIIYGYHGVSAQAMPNGFHPIVESRRNLAFSQRTGSISLSEADEIRKDSMGPVGRGYASDLEGALTSLEQDMKALVKA